jgi:hypothetical protein
MGRFATPPKLVAGAVLVLLAAACTSVIVSSGQRAASDHGKEAATGPRIVFGAGHFARDAKPFHYWDKEKAIPAVCARCHAVDGLEVYLRDGRNVEAPHAKNAFMCTNCHAELLTYALRPVAKVTFPGGATVDSGDGKTNLCMTCHQGRESKASVDKAISGLEADTPNDKLGFVHVHYYPAGATRFGTEAQVGYEYPGKQYVGQFTHVAPVNTCTGCHRPHEPGVKSEQCSTCHAEAKRPADVRNIRMSRGDFDGNGREEGMAQEVENLKKELYVTIQRYAVAVGKRGIAFSPSGFPYWFADLNGNGVADPDEQRPNNPYKAYTPRLMQAVYNYTFVLRDPGAAYHNGRYAVQLLHDSLESLGHKVPVSLTDKTRP